MKCRLLTDKSYSENVQSPAVHFRLCFSLSCERPMWQVEMQGGQGWVGATLSELWGNVASCVCWCAGDGKAKYVCFVLFCYKSWKDRICFIHGKRKKLQMCLIWRVVGKTPSIKSYLPITMTQMSRLICLVFTGWKE